MLLQTVNVDKEHSMAEKLAGLSKHGPFNTKFLVRKDHHHNNPLKCVHSSTCIISTISYDLKPEK